MTTPFLPVARFDGETYEPEHDAKRLRSQLERVFYLMRDGEWRSLGRIAELAGGSEASVSARLRDLRKEKFGAHEVDRRRVEGGLFEYRLVPPCSEHAIAFQPRPFFPEFM